MRGVQLLNLFDKREGRTFQNSGVKINVEGRESQRMEDIIGGYENMKVAEIARDVLVPILESGKLSEEIINLMEGNEYSKEMFDLQYPIITKKSLYTSKPLRYYAKPVVNINGEEYYLCSEWYENEGGNNDRPYLLKWINDNR
ncbi:MAG: hypothetical protein ACRC7N_10315 [Clostridium sp.]